MLSDFVCLPTEGYAIILRRLLYARNCEEGDRQEIPSCRTHTAQTIKEYALMWCKLNYERYRIRAKVRNRPPINNILERAEGLVSHPLLFIAYMDTLNQYLDVSEIEERRKLSKEEKNSLHFFRTVFLESLLTLLHGLPIYKKIDTMDYVTQSQLKRWDKFMGIRPPSRRK